MKYYKYTLEQEGLINLVELDEEYFCHRAIFMESDEMFSSNIVNKKDKYILPEGSFEEFVNQLQEISEKEFLNQWKIANRKYYQDFDKYILGFSIGQKIKAKIICFYPQGIIFQLNSQFNGIADYEECKNKFGLEKMCTNQELALQFGDVDKENLMIKLKTKTTYNIS